MKGYQRRSASTRNLDARSRNVPGWDLNKGPLPPPSLRLTTSPLKIERAQLTNPRIFASHLWVRVVYLLFGACRIADRVSIGRRFGLAEFA